MNRSFERNMKLKTFYEELKQKKKKKTLMTIKSLKDYKANLYSALTRDLSDFEKNFLLVTGGILAFSITFIKDIVKVDSAGHLFYLFAGWILIASAIGLMMVTFLTSAYASDAVSKMIDQYQGQINKWEESQELTEDEFNAIRTKTQNYLMQRKGRLRFLRYAAIGCFLAGLLSFGYFVGYNIYMEKKKTKEKTETIIYNKKKNQVESSDFKVISNDSTLIIQKQ